MTIGEVSYVTSDKIQLKITKGVWEKLTLSYYLEIRLEETYTKPQNKLFKAPIETNNLQGGSMDSSHYIVRSVGFV